MTLDELITASKNRSKFSNETYYGEVHEALLKLKQLFNQVPVAEFVTLFNTPKGTVEFLGRVPDRKLCDLKEGDLLYKQEIVPAQQSPAVEWIKNHAQHPDTCDQVTSRYKKPCSCGLIEIMESKQSPAVAVINVITQQTTPAK